VTGPGARWRNCATKVVMAGVVLAAVVAGCSSPPAVPRGSVNACYHFGMEAIQRRVTVTAVPAACQGLSQLEVNVAVGRALQAAAAGVPGKARQRQLIGRDSPYLAGLIHAVPAPGQPAVAAPQSGPPSSSPRISPPPPSPSCSPCSPPWAPDKVPASQAPWLLTQPIVTLLSRGG